MRIRLRGCVVDTSLREVLVGLRTHKLTEIEAGLLEALANAGGAAVSRQHLLRTVWGYRAAAGRPVDHVVKRLRRKLEVDAAQPLHLVSVRGEGYALRQLSSSDFDVEASATNLLVRSTPLIGRESLIDRVVRLVATGERLVTLVGPAGVGKSRLAEEVGLRILESGHLSGGAWFVDLFDATEVVHVDALTRRALRQGDASSAESLHELVRNIGPAVLVLDGGEHLLGALGEVITSLRRSAPNVRILLTSRRRLEHPDERIVRVEPLAPDEASLLLQQLCERRTDSAVSPELIDEMVPSLGGLPLAIELAANCLGSMPKQELMERFAAGSGVAEPLHLAVRRSWELLSDDERSVLAQCLVFRGGFSLSEAVDVVDCPSSDAFDVLLGLRDAHMLRVVGDGLETKSYRPYDAVWSFVMAEVGEPEDRVRHRHALVYAARAALARQRWVELELDNLQAAASFALEAKLTEIGPLLLALGESHLVKSDWFAQVALRAVDEGVAEPKAHPSLLAQRALCAFRRGNPEQCEALLDRAEDLAATQNNDAGLIRALSLRAVWRSRSGHEADGVALARRVLTLSEERGVLDHRTIGALNLVVVSQMRHRLFAETAELLMPWVEHGGLRFWRSLPNTYLAIALLARGRLTEAADASGRAAQLAREDEDAKQQGVALAIRASVFAAARRFDDAHDALQQAARLSGHALSPTTKAWLARAGALAHLLAGDCAKALVSADEALVWGGRTLFPVAQGFAHSMVALAAWATSDQTRATAALVSAEGFRSSDRSPEVHDVYVVAHAAVHATTVAKSRLAVRRALREQMSLGPVHAVATRIADAVASGVISPSAQ